MTKKTRYFLLTFRAADRSLHTRDFGADETAATAAYSALELELGASSEVEVVLVGADSLATIRKTHSHYFTAEQDLLETIKKNLLVAT